MSSEASDGIDSERSEEKTFSIKWKRNWPSKEQWIHKCLSDLKVLTEAIAKRNHSTSAQFLLKLSRKKHLSFRLYPSWVPKLNLTLFQKWGLHFGMPSLSLSLLMLVAIEKGRLPDEVNLDAKTRPCRLWQLPAGQAFALTLNISRGNHWQWTMMMMVMIIMMMMERVRNWGGKKETS